MKKRILSLALVLVLCLSLVPLTASATSITEKEVNEKFTSAEQKWKNNTTYKNEQGERCLEFCRELFYYVFCESIPKGYSLKDARFTGTEYKANVTEIAHLSEGYSENDAKALLVQAKPGDVLITAKGHNHIVMIRSVTDGGSTMYVYDANWAPKIYGNNKIFTNRKYTAKQLKNEWPTAATLYRYKDYSDGSTTTPVNTTITWVDVVAPASFTVGTDAPLSGEIRSTNSTLCYVKAEVINANTAKVEMDAVSEFSGIYKYGPLSNSKINTVLNLGNLSAGTYYLRYYARTENGYDDLHTTSNFTVNPVSCNGNHTKGAFQFYEANHPHYKFWKCAVCGQNFIDGSIETVSSCDTCNPPEPASPTPSTPPPPPSAPVPASTPSTAPSVTPSTTPSTTPSATPSAAPSTTPSATPSAAPSTTSSATSSTTPSTMPSTTPSATPSTKPSATPSTAPSGDSTSSGGGSATTTTTVARDFTDWGQVRHKNAVAACSDLHIINGKDDGSFDPASNIDRASWAKMVYYAATGNHNADDYYAIPSGLNDIDGHWAQSYITYLALNNLVAGDGTGNFRPDRNVTVVEACKMMLTILGYDADDRGYQFNKAWEDNIMTDAKRNGLMSNVDETQTALVPLTRDNAAEIVYNALHATTQKYDNGSYTSGDTLMFEVFHVRPSQLP